MGAIPLWNRLMEAGADCTGAATAAHTCSVRLDRPPRRKGEGCGASLFL